MDLETAVRAALHGELGIIMKNTEEAQMIVDLCRDLGADTEYMPVAEVPSYWEVFGVNQDYPNKEYSVFWSDQRAFEIETGVDRCVRFSDLLPSMVDFSGVEALL